MEMEVWRQPKVADKKANRKRVGKQRGRISEMERKQKRKRKWKISPSFLGFLRKGNKSAILTITRKKPHSKSPSKLKTTEEKQCTKE